MVAKGMGWVSAEMCSTAMSKCISSLLSTVYGECASSSKATRRPGVASEGDSGVRGGERVADCCSTDVSDNVLAPLGCVSSACIVGRAAAREECAAWSRLELVTALYISFGVGERRRGEQWQLFRILCLSLMPVTVSGGIAASLVSWHLTRERWRSWALEEARQRRTEHRKTTSLAVRVRRSDLGHCPSPLSQYQLCLSAASLLPRSSGMSLSTCCGPRFASCHSHQSASPLDFTQLHHSRQPCSRSGTSQPACQPAHSVNAVVQVVGCSSRYVSATERRALQR